MKWGDARHECEVWSAGAAHLPTSPLPLSAYQRQWAGGKQCGQRTGGTKASVASLV